MKITVNTKELSNALSLVGRGIDTKSSIPILVGVKLETRENLLHLTGSNLNLNIETNISAEVYENGSVVVDFRRLIEIIKKMPNDSVTIVTKDSKLTIISGKVKIDIKYVESTDYPEIPVVKSNFSFGIKSGDFKELIDSVIFSIAKEDTRPILTGVLFECINNRLKFVAVDGYRMATKETSVICEDFLAVVPGNTLIELTRILSNLSSSDTDVLVSIGNDKVSFKFDSVSIVSKLMEGNFINYKSIIREDTNTNLVVDRLDFLNMLDRISLVCTDERLIRLSIDAKENKLHSKGVSHFGVIEEELDCEVEGAGIEIGFNTKYLVDILKSLNDEKITISLINSVSPAIIKEENNYLYLILPIRMVNN